MLKFEPNLAFLFREVPFFDRFQAARDAGFTHAEFLSLLTHDPNTLIQAVRDSGIQIVQYNFLDGDLEAGERGFASHPDQRHRWRQALEAALDMASQIHPLQVHSIAGVRIQEMLREEQIAVLVENLKWAVPRLEKAGIPMMLEALNNRDNPGYLLQTTDAVIDVLQRVHSPWIQFQFDFYHIQCTQGDLIRHFQASLPYIGHIQIADNPGRHEPGTGEINYRAVLSALDQSAYSRFVGLEFHPTTDTQAALAWLPIEARSRACTVDELLL